MEVVAREVKGRQTQIWRVAPHGGEAVQPQPAKESLPS
jgi:hypothetical protein